MTSLLIDHSLLACSAPVDLGLSIDHCVDSHGLSSIVFQLLRPNPVRPLAVITPYAEHLMKLIVESCYQS